MRTKSNTRGKRKSDDQSAFAAPNCSAVFPDCKILDYLDLGTSVNQSHLMEALMNGDVPFGSLRVFASELMRDDLERGISLPNAEVSHDAERRCDH